MSSASSAAPGSVAPRSLQAAACLTEDELVRVMEHTISPGEMRRIDEHVVSCAACWAWWVAVVQDMHDEPVATSSFDTGSMPPSSRGSRERERGVVYGDRWTIESFLGAGEMADVFAARHRNGREVALKVLKQKYCSMPEAIRRFRREARVANQLQHPAILRVLDDDVSPTGRPFLVLERLYGQTLRHKLALGTLGDLSARIGYLHTTLDALALAHVQGIVHRDIKPENLFLQDDGQLRLLDFGLARVLESPEMSVLTVQGEAVGTPAYMAPEQADGNVDKVGPAADVYAAGMTLLELLLERLPDAVGRTLHERRASPDLPGCSELAPSIPRALWPVVDRALAADPERRYPSAVEMRIALEFAAAQMAISLPGRGPEGSPPPAPARTSMPSSGLATAVISLLVASVAACAWWISRPAPELPANVIPTPPPPQVEVSPSPVLTPQPVVAVDASAPRAKPKVPAPAPPYVAPRTREPAAAVPDASVKELLDRRR